MAETLLRTHRREPSGNTILALDGESLCALDRVRQQIEKIGQVVGIGQVVNPHLQQLRRLTLDDLAKSMVGQIETPGGIDLGDAHAGAAEQDAQDLLLLTQLGFDPFARRHIGAHGKAHDRGADHERDQRQEGCIAGRRRKRPAAGQGAPDRKTRENERAGGGVALAAA